MSFFDRKISDELLGKRVREAHLAHRRRVAENTPRWIKEGAEKRKRRDTHKISRREMKKKIGISEQTIVKFKKGGSIRYRNLFSGGRF